MLSENIKTIRKSKGLSQEELAIQLNVVRQTVSKWEQGLSVPDSDLLVALSKALDTPVSVLLGETVPDSKEVDLSAIAERLEEINAQFARRKNTRRRVLHWLFILLGAATVALIALLIRFPSPYLGWDNSDPEIAVFQAVLHASEWLFVRFAPFALIGETVGIILTRKKG